jgi:ribosomal protein L17
MIGELLLTLIELVDQYSTKPLTVHQRSLASIELVDDARAIEKLIDDTAKKYCERKGLK